MKLRKLILQNYRCFEQIEIDFQENYTALSGANDAGKSNIIEAVRILLGPGQAMMFSRPPAVDFDTDYPKWRSTDNSPDDTISIKGDFTLEPITDKNLGNFILRQLELPEQELSGFSLEVSVSRKAKSVRTQIQANEIIRDGEQAREVWRRLQSGGSMVLHNSTTDAFRLVFGDHFGGFSDISEAVSKAMAQLRSDAAKKMKRVMASSQSELQDLLGRLSDQLTVSLDLPDISTEVPLNILLGDKAVSVPLSGWGSGTKNRTMILLALLRVAQARKQPTESDKPIPLIIIEEPESFLHFKAQAEFGALLIELARELDVQVIVTTHSFYLLNTQTPQANVLLGRKIARGKTRASAVQASSGESWLEPFSAVLGLSAESLAPWEGALAARQKKVVLVEGPTDAAYLELLKDKAHGPRSLNSDIVIVQYHGCGNIKNTAALRVMLQLAERAVVTFDLDAIAELSRAMDTLELKRGEGYIAIGIDRVGRRAIEGLLPEHIKAEVRVSCAEHYDALMDAQADKQSAKNRIKSASLEAFKTSAKPGPDYEEFYKLAMMLNKALA